MLVPVLLVKGCNGCCFCAHELHVAAGHCLLLHLLLMRTAAAASEQRIYLAALVV